MKNADASSRTKVSRAKADGSEPKAAPKKAAAATKAKAPPKKAAAVTKAKAAPKAAAATKAKAAPKKAAAATKAKAAPTKAAARTTSVSKAAATTKAKAAPLVAATRAKAQDTAKAAKAKLDALTKATSEKVKVATAQARSTIRKAAKKTKTTKKSASKARAPRGVGDRSQAQKAGVHELGWNGVETACRGVANEIRRGFEAEVVIGLAKGGIFAGEELASILGLPFFSLRIHPRSRDEAKPRDEQPPPEVAGRRVLVVDDIAGTGVSIDAASEAMLEAGAKEVRTVTLVVRETGYRPDYWNIETSDLVVFPWDYNLGFGVSTMENLDD